MNLIKIVEGIVTGAHFGQFRRDGVTPYVTHPQEVKRITTEWIDDYFNQENKFPEETILISKAHYSGYGTMSRENLTNLISILSLGHDLGEDTTLKEEQFINLIQLRLTEHKLSILSYAHVNLLKDALFLLNKNNFKNYLSYIVATKTNEFSRIVKAGDITHNLSTLEPNRKLNNEKYELARYIILN